MKRVALISDAHGNAVGLGAALDDIAQRDVDVIVALGDMVQGGPQPAECVVLLRDANARVVLGNSDAFLLDIHASREEPTERHLIQRDWTLAQLAEDQIGFIRAFPPTIELDLVVETTSHFRDEGHLDENRCLTPIRSAARLLCFHGTPGSYDDVVLPEDPPDLFVADADLLAGGHVHVPQLRRVGESWYVNPGSVGLGYDHRRADDDFRFDAWASYAIVSATSVEFHRVPFDLDELDRATRAAAMPRAGEVFERYRRS